MLVVSVDTCDGPRAYVGMAYGYHEHITEGFDRLTDERWVDEVLRKDPASVSWLTPILGP